MLRIYRRHRTSCPHRSESYRRCPCPIYVKGTLGGSYLRMSLDQTNWDAASRIVAGWTKAGSVGQIRDAESMTVADAVAEFMADARARNLSEDTLAKYRRLFEQRLLTFCEQEHYPTLASLTLTALTAFRATWTQDSAITKFKTQERLRWFFGWCVKRKYLDDNPALGLTKVKVVEAPTMPFTQEQYLAVLRNIPKLRNRNAYGHDVHQRVKAFVLLLRWTGLRIRDVAVMRWVKVQGAQIFLYTQKTGTPVVVPIPPECVEALNAIPRRGEYIFWTGKGKEKTFVSNWQRTLRKVFLLAGIPDGHAHRFRDTFAVELLLTGVDIADVSVLLGHSSVKITERHYAPWVKARQARLATAVQRSWAPASED